MTHALRTAQIIVPARNNAGYGLADLRTWVQKTLVEDFGGFTATHSFGGWKSPDGTVVTEAVMVYTIAMEDLPINVQRLHHIARIVVEDAQQEAVYVQNPNGTICFITANDTTA
jgi:hypothetical protein